MRRALVLPLLLLACSPPDRPRPAPEAPPTPAAPASVTVGERVPYPFAQLIETPSVALKGGGAIGVSAQICGGCHVENAREWRASTHAQAMADPQYLAELAKPSSPRWLCLSCHRPLQIQAPLRQQADSPLVGTHANSVGQLASRPNRGHVPALAHEAITCATCHVRPGADGKGVVIGPRGDTAAPHRVTQGRAGLRGVCNRCHTPGPGHVTPAFTCWFETQDELAAGPQADKDCVDCHMPPVRRPLAPGGPVRDTRRHTWLGGGVPKTFAGYAHLQAQGWQPGIDVTVGRPIRGADGVRIPVALSNPRGGHAVPSADPERHLRVIARSGRHRWGARIGQTWDWGDDATGRKAKRLSDNRLKPGEVRTLEARLPPEATGEVVVEVAHVRLAPDTLRYARQARLDDGLRAHRPNAQAVVAALDQHYPSFTWIHRSRWAPRAQAPVVTPLADLLRESAQPRDPATLDAVLATTP